MIFWGFVLNRSKRWLLFLVLFSILLPSVASLVPIIIVKFSIFIFRHINLYKGRAHFVPKIAFLADVRIRRVQMNTACSPYKWATWASLVLTSVSEVFCA